MWMDYRLERKETGNTTHRFWLLILNLDKLLTCNMHLRMNKNQHSRLVLRKILPINRDSLLNSTVLLVRTRTIGHCVLCPSRRELYIHTSGDEVCCFRSRQTLWRTSRWNGYAAVLPRIHRSSPSTLDVWTWEWRELPAAKYRWKEKLILQGTVLKITERRLGQF